MLDEIRAIEKDLTLRRLLRSGRGSVRKAVLAEPLGFIFTLLLLFTFMHWEQDGRATRFLERTG